MSSRSVTSSKASNVPESSDREVREPAMKIDYSRIRFFKPHDGIGRPITPEIVDAFGLITTFPEVGLAFRRDGDWTHSYQCWATSGAKKELIYPQGKIVLARSGSESGAEFVLSVRYRLAGSGRSGDGKTMRGPHLISALVTCRTDETATPVSWRLGSEHFDKADARIASVGLSETGEYSDGTIRIAKPDTFEFFVDGPLASDWGLFEAVQRLTFDPMSRLRFSLLDGLALLKGGQRILYAGKHRLHLAGATRVLHCFRQTGRGIPPIEYWLDDNHRLLLVVNVNRFWVLNDLNDEARSHPQLRDPEPVPIRYHANRRPNIVPRRAAPDLVLIFTDQQAASAFSAAGNRFVSTPALDSLCRRGVRFVDSFCTNPICSPSRS